MNWSGNGAPTSESLESLPAFVQTDVDLEVGLAARPKASHRREIEPEAVIVPQRQSGFDESFWAEVASLRRTAGDRLAKSITDSEGLNAASREEVGRSIIEQVVRDTTDTLLVGGTQRWDSHHQAHLKSAVFDALFRLGRLQPLVDDETIENVKIYGYDRVFVLRTTGEIEQVPPVAYSDEDLITMLQDLAAREEDRSFTRATPMLDLPLPNRGRLAATGWITASGRPEVTIRIQRLRDATLTKLRDQAEIDPLLQNFLVAAVQARRSIVVSGQSQGSGKTTMLRALANEIPPWEVIATIESEPELYLHEATDTHPMVNSYIARRGSGEKDGIGRRIGEITTLDVIPSALRHTITRIIVGEVRHHRELDAMFEAMQMGNGSMTTLHADSPDLVLARLVRMASYATGNPGFAHQEVGDLIDLVVYLGMRRDAQSGRLYRYVREVSEVAYSGDAGRAINKPIFAPGPDGRAVPAGLPSGNLLSQLESHGFDRAMFSQNPQGLWPVPVVEP